MRKIFTMALGVCAVAAVAATAAHGDVFVHSTTMQDPENVGGLFGFGVAPAAGNVVVSAPFNAAATGAAYLFDVGTGQIIRTFANPTPAPIDMFGYPLLAFQGDLLVGAPYEDDTGALSTGSVYRFDPDTGALLNTYSGPAGAESFGWSIAARGDDIIVGARSSNQGAGSAYVIDGDTGAVLLTLTNPNAGTWDFGRSVAALGNDVLVGGNGRATLFNGTTGAVIRVLQPAGGGSYVGWSMSAAGSEVLISESSAAYLFNGATGALLRTFPGPGDFAVLHLGDGRAVVGGAIYSTTTGALVQTVDAAYAYAHEPPRLFAGAAVYVEEDCLNPECDPDTDACCNPATCSYDKCDPNVDPCCDSATCDFVQCNPETNPCCDAATCGFKPAAATCVQATGSGAGCKTGECDANHVCQPVNVTNIDDGTSCTAQVNPCFNGVCNNGVCQPPDGPSTPWADRCEDANVCTDDAAACVTDVTGAFVRCAFGDPDVFEADGTTCSTTSGAICTVKTCQDGTCQAGSPPVTKDCSSLPQVQTCRFNTCQLDAQGQPVCVADQPLPAGTVCESTVPSTDWDCKHYRCSSRGRCRGKRASEGKVCDYAPGVTPAEHCQLAICNTKGKCAAPPLYSTLAVVQAMETAGLDGDGNPVAVDMPTCPNDGNMCTFDRCSGGSDACTNPCITGAACAGPGTCEGECQVVGSACQCVDIP